MVFEKSKRSNDAITSVVLSDCRNDMILIVHRSAQSGLTRIRNSLRKLGPEILEGVPEFRLRQR